MRLPAPTVRSRSINLKKLALALFAALILLLAEVLICAARFGEAQGEVPRAEFTARAGAAEQLAEAIRITAVLLGSVGTHG